MPTSRGEMNAIADGVLLVGTMEANGSLTALADEIMKLNGGNAAEALKDVRTAFGLAAGLIGEGGAHSLTPIVSYQLLDTVTMLAAASGQPEAAVYTALAGEIVGSSSMFDLGSADAVADVAVHLGLRPELIACVSQVVAQANALLASDVAAAGADQSSVLLAVTAASIVAQDITAADLGFAAGLQDVTAVNDEFARIGDSLRNLIDSARALIGASDSDQVSDDPISDLQPPALSAALFGSDHEGLALGDSTSMHQGGAFAHDPFDSSEGSTLFDDSGVDRNVAAGFETVWLYDGRTGDDTIFGAETIKSVIKNSTIVASMTVNVLEGGLGHNTFVFASAVDADGDTIIGFQPGDRIDLSGMTDQGDFTLETTGLSGAGQVLVTHEVRADGVHTLVQGNVTGGTEPDFTIDVLGHHDLTVSDFKGVI